jgi:serine/threonine protein kinase/tetratricopeptide (TPR) repeat protein
MNPPEPFRVAATSDSNLMSEGPPQARPLPWPNRLEAGNAGSATFRHDDSSPMDVDTDAALAELAEEMTRRLESGERVDVEDYVARYPDWAGPIRRLVPVVRGMVEMARSVDPVRAAGEAERAHDGLSGEGRVLDDFRILREVGRGGMGIVYEAEQISLGRRVALKVLPLAAAMDPRALQRFQLEAQAAALLQHPRIVPVYAVGALGDVPYYAMQFIEGASLAELVAEMRRLVGLGTDGLPNKDRVEGISSLARGLLSGRFALQDQEDENSRPDLRSDAEAASSAPSVGPAPSGRGASSLLETSTRGRDYSRTVAHLGLQAAEALEYAHGQGILHRDVKPANLILDRRGVLWVTDFGLARVPWDGGLTLTGDVLGTLRYMSPEQAVARRAVIDRRTDIYSLGATLYELLTLQPSVPGTDRQEILRRIIEDDPVPIRRLNSAVPVDLATIIAKAMCKDPAGRYETAQHFADDLKRFLEGRAIAARPIGPLERAWRWCRRKPLPAGLAAGLVVASIAGVVGVTWSWRDAVRQRDLLARAQRLILAALDRESRANKALLMANAHERVSREQAQRRFALAREAVEQYYTGASEEVLLKQPQMESLRKRLLGMALLFYKRLQATLEEGPDDPRTRAELAAVYCRVGQIAVEVGSRHEGLEALEQARAIQEELVRANPTAPGPRRDLASCLEFIGRLQLYTSGRESEGLRSLERSLDLFEELSGDHPDDPQDRFAVAATAGEIGYERARMGRTAEGLWSLKRERDILERLVAEYPGNTSYRNQLAQSYNDLGKIQACAGQLPEALHAQQQATTHFEILAADERANAVYRRRLGQVETDLARILTNAGRPAEALPHSERGLSILEKVAAELPAVDSYQRAVAECYDMLGSAQASMGRRDEALRSLAKARLTLERLAAEHPDFVAYQEDLAENHLWTGAVYQDLGRSAEALRDLSKARELLERMLPGSGNLYDLARTESRLSALTGAADRRLQADRALTILRRAIAKGYRSPDALRTDPSLDPLRSRADFLELLRDLEFPDNPFSP